MIFIVIQELESRYGHGASFSGQLATPIVYLLEFNFGVVETTSTKVMDCIVALKTLTVTHKPVVIRCQALESVTEFYLLGYVSGKGFYFGLWDHEGLRYDSAKCYTKWKNETSNWKEGTNLTVQVEEIAE